ncbi:MAG: hypothetical protein AAFN77_23500 [Planctomycetota bacterium]
MNTSEFRLQHGNFRQQFAAFLDRLANGTVDSAEWSNFVVTHYDDELLEEFRRLTSRMESGYMDKELDSKGGKELLQTWAAELRASTAN